jgi:hypothetical protein
MAGPGISLARPTCRRLLRQNNIYKKFLSIKRVNQSKKIRCASLTRYENELGILKIFPESDNFIPGGVQTYTDPRSNNSTKRGGEKIYCPPFFLATNIITL